MRSKEKKISEEANARYNDLLNQGLDYPKEEEEF